MKKNDEKTSVDIAQKRFILCDETPFHAKEAYKALRTNVMFSMPGGGCKCVGVTSAMPSEGKSTTAINLSISLAQIGKRVLLIDADMRRPALSRLMVEKANPGLSEVLGGLVTSREAVRKDIYPNLDILFSGDTPPNPSELLGSETMQELIEEIWEGAK